jgi:hypothetical protein
MPDTHPRKSRVKKNKGPAADAAEPSCMRALWGLAVAACHRSGITRVGVGRCSTLGRASTRRRAHLNADHARDADINARTRFLGTLGRGRRHFISERGGRKERNASRPDRDFAQDLHRYLRTCWLMAMRKQPEMQAAVPRKNSFREARIAGHIRDFIHHRPGDSNQRVYTE